MAIMHPLFRKDDPRLQDYMTRNPNSMFTQFYNKRYGVFVDPGVAAGSNNAVGSVATSPTQTPTRGFIGGGSWNLPTPNTAGGNNPNTIYSPGLGTLGAADPQNQAGYTVPSFAAGGMMSPAGMPIRPGQPMGGAVPRDEPMLGADQPAPMKPEQINQEVQNFMRTNPQAVQAIQASLVQALQSGELSQDELNLAVQLAKAALANPASYPQIRQFAIQNGLGTEQDIPQQMDQGIVIALLVAGQALQQAGGKAPGAQPPAPSGRQAGLLPSYEDGGFTGGKAHLAKIHPREYVATEAALLYHGKKTYDKLEEQARAPKDGTQ